MKKVRCRSEVGHIGNREDLGDLNAMTQMEVE